jgi:hypothetical protein
MRVTKRDVLLKDEEVMPDFDRASPKLEFD